MDIDSGTLVITVRVFGVGSMMHARRVTLARIPCEFNDAHRLTDEWQHANAHVRQARIEFVRASIVLAE